MVSKCKIMNARVSAKVAPYTVSGQKSAKTSNVHGCKDYSKKNG